MASELSPTGVSIGACTGTDRFTGTEQTPLQVVSVVVRRTRPAGPLTVRVEGPGVRTPHPRLLIADTAEAYAVVDGEGAETADSGTRQPEPSEQAEPEQAEQQPEARETEVEVPVYTGTAAPGSTLPFTATVAAADGTVLAEQHGELTVEQTGWTIHLLPHFHYDPMWWNTQAAYTALWDAPLRPGQAERGWEYSGVPALTLIPLHLQRARDEPDYRFVLSELDYFKPFWDSRPEYRAELRALLASGRLELVGGTYNEPSTNLTSAESTVRSAVHGTGFLRGVVGGGEQRHAPRSAWQLDVFGHDPSFPALMAGAGLDSAVLARGPHHHWGPMMDTWGAAMRTPDAMQVPAEHQWIGPSGEGLLLHYLPAHYSCGWFSNAAESAEQASAQLAELYGLLKHAAATRNVLIPVGTDFSWPHRWAPQVRREWNARYLWPRFRHSTAREFFDSVRGELAASGRRPLPVTRDFNPVYTGKDVSYSDIKQANRLAENLVQQAETFAALSAAGGLSPYPEAALDRVWRHLLHGAHHDGITGTFSDQVYLDLVPTWREAHDLALRLREEAQRALAGAADTRSPVAADGGPDVTDGGPAVALTVFNPLSWQRADVLSAEADVSALGLRDPARLALRDADGALSPVQLEAGRRAADGTVSEVSLTVLADGVPGIGYRTWWLVDAGRPLSGGWTADAEAKADAGTGTGTTVQNARFRLTADPARGGGLSSVLDLRDGRELLSGGAVDELVVHQEYSAHPYFGEGPWHLLPNGESTGSAEAPAESVTVEHGPLGSRIIARGRTGPARWARTATLFNGLDRVELTTAVEEFDGSDQLLRLRLPADVPGAQPVAETAAAAVGRGFGFPDADTGTDHTRAPWTLDSPCLNWFALSSTAAVELHGPDGEPAGLRAIGAAEIVLPDAGLPGYADPAVDAASAPTEPATDPLRPSLTTPSGRSLSPTPTRPNGEAADLRAIGAAEIVLPDADLPGHSGPIADDASAFTVPAAEPDADPLRSLVTALVRRGVTATPTRPDGTRWGDLASDSSLPDVRLSLGGPAHNAFTRRVLDTAGPHYPQAVDAAQQTADQQHRPVLVWVPANRPLREVWQPGMDLTGERDLPVAIVLLPSGGPAGNPAALGALAAALDEAPRLSALLPVPADHHPSEELAERTVGMLVRGTPSFVIDTEGRLNSSLLRSSTGRPSGQWMDPPARSVPDGSAFQLQHWTHTFEHALVAEDGDWRAADLVRRGREFNNPLSAVAAAPAPGPQPPTRVLLGAEPAERVLIETVKPAGNPYAEHRRDEADGTSARPLAVRLHETTGRTAEVRLTGAHSDGPLRRADLLEHPAGAAPLTALTTTGNAYDTVLLGPGTTIPTIPPEPVTAPNASRYWLHNTGTAPLGNAPLSVTAAPELITAAPGEPIRCTVTTASNHAADTRRDEPDTIVLTLELPTGWTSDWTELAAEIPAGEHTTTPLRLLPPAVTHPGEYLIRVTATPPRGAATTDTVTVVVPTAQPDGAHSSAPLTLTVELPTEPVTVAAGARTEPTITLRNPFPVPVRGEAFLVSPYGSWPAVPNAAIRFELPAGGSAALPVLIAPPTTATPGQYWLLVKTVHDGRITYSPAIRLRILAPEGS